MKKRYSISHLLTNVALIAACIFLSQTRPSWLVPFLHEWWSALAAALFVQIVANMLGLPFLSRWAIALLAPSLASLWWLGGEIVGQKFRFGPTEIMISGLATFGFAFFVVELIAAVVRIRVCFTSH